jgi:2-keto-3-deoxy-L-rhamnonate aldolase RhmA
MEFGDYMQRANRELSIIVQVEHIDSVVEIESIVAVPGIDALFVGPYDLSASLGKTGQVDDPEVLEAISRVRDCALAAGVPLGIFGADPESVRDHIKSGYRLVAVGIDALLLGQAAHAVVSSFRQS